jgi:hypothetical protein
MIPSRHLVSTLADHLLFGLAMLFLIPPIPSMDGETEKLSFFKPMAFVLVLLSGSRYLALRRKEETWLGWILKAVIFVAAGFAMYARAKYLPV